MSKKFFAAATALGAFAPGFFSERTRKLQGIDIEKEYKLIQQKKSKLPAATRRLVVIEYEARNKYENN